MGKHDRTIGPALNDWHLWSEVTRSVSPLRRAQKPKSQVKPAVPAKKARKAEKTKSTSSGGQVWSPGATPIQHTPTAQTPTASHDQVIEPRIRRRLSRGQLPIDATIDLHGLRQHEAHAALCRFVAARHARGDRTLLVITGKGLKKTGYGAIEQRGVLRTMLPVWLNEPALKPYVSGYEVSARGHGGEGAYYVRLKRGGK